MQCKECNRKLPNKKFITKHGCRWCDKTVHTENKK